MAGILELQAALQAAIVGVPVNLGNKELFRNLVYPQFFIFPVRESYAGPQGAGAAGNPRLLHTRKLSLEVHTWGPDYGTTEQMFGAFVTALRQVVQGASYALEGSEWEEPQDLNTGVTLSSMVTVVYGMAISSLPIQTPLVVPTGAFGTVVITSEGNDTAGTVFGDGKLDSGEG